MLKQVQHDKLRSDIPLILPFSPRRRNIQSSPLEILRFAQYDGICTLFSIKYPPLPRISNTPIVRIEILPLPQSGGEIYCISIRTHQLEMLKQVQHDKLRSDILLILPFSPRRRNIQSSPLEILRFAQYDGSCTLVGLAKPTYILIEFGLINK